MSFKIYTRTDRSLYLKRTRNGDHQRNKKLLKLSLTVTILRYCQASLSAGLIIYKVSYILRLETPFDVRLRAVGILESLNSKASQLFTALGHRAWYMYNSN